MVVEKIKSHKLPGTDQIPAELIKSGAEQLAMKSTNLLILYGIRRNCLSSERSRSLCLFIRRALKQIVVIIEAYHFCQLRTTFYAISYRQD